MEGEHISVALRKRFLYFTGHLKIQHANESARDDKELQQIAVFENIKQRCNVPPGV